jgi:hypothetical protein
MNKRDQKPDPLGGAINQLETLLQKQAKGDAVSNNRQLPILDEIVDPEAPREDDAPEPAVSGFSQEELEDTMTRLTEQLEMELETLSALLKENMLYEFRKEITAAMGVDPDSEEPKMAPGSKDNDTNMNRP